MNGVACESGQRETGGAPDGPGNDDREPGGRVLVVFDASRAGTAALREAIDWAGVEAELSVVTLVPQAKPLKCCGGGGAGPYNCAVRDEAEDQLDRARGLLGSSATRATFTKLVGSPTPPLAEWSAEGGFDVIFLPAPRLARGGGRLARELRRATAAEVRLVR